MMNKLLGNIFFLFVFILGLSVRESSLPYRQNAESSNAHFSMSSHPEQFRAGAGDINQELHITEDYEQGDIDFLEFLMGKDRELIEVTYLFDFSPILVT